ncbi:hypothetical protein XU18_0615 [Perkinsela sp. CCAP 1560/4]|nr:hypothetical protein XU18_3654 [Perkinsela sp. CCAP 1560/4]KNH09105.1 hypothetical protein XU18_0615 [Perkinsela sp. CCAP 1560/4]|eukprot:KNH05335.1 hypothetical protein XU18_3654 [Perkinsela sp. CCAP 1560/4]
MPEQERGSEHCDESLSCMEDSENYLWEKKAYETRIARQPLILGPGTERFLDGKMPLSPLSHAATHEGAFEGIRLDLTENHSKTFEAYAESCAYEQNLISKITDQGNVRANLVVLIGRNNWFDGHLISRLVASGYKVFFAAQEKVVDGIEGSSNDILSFSWIYGASGLPNPRRVIIDKLINEYGTIHSLELARALKDASVVIDNVFSRNESGKNVYPLLSIIESINRQRFNGAGIIKLIIGRSQWKAFSVSDFSIESREEIIRRGKLVQTKVVFLSHGTLLGPFRLNYTCTQCYQCSGIPKLLKESRIGLHMFNDYWISPVDVRDVTKAYLRIIEIPEIRETQYHLARPPISKTCLFRALQKHQGGLNSISFFDKLIGSIAFLFECAENMELWVTKESGQFQCAEKLQSQLGIRMRPLNATLKTTFQEYSEYSQHCEATRESRSPRFIPVSIGMLLITRFLYSRYCSN